ncbi:Cytochrome f, partial [Melia azedarach]
MIYIITRASISNAYPIFAQQGFENPREATGRIVCANCHLANKPVDIEVPQAVLPDTVFEAVVKIPYDMQLKQVLANGGNRGRGQIYPDGNKSNNTVYNATAAGVVNKIIRKAKGGYEITITDASNGREVVDIIPPGPELRVSEGQSIKLDQPLTSNPNVGGFGQADAEIVLQDPLRVQVLL